MSTLHPTISDKDRGPTGGVGTIGLIEDGEWHWYSIRDNDGVIKRAIVVPDGTYEVIVANSGNILEPGGTDIEVHVTRYHLQAVAGKVPGEAATILNGEEGALFHDSTAWSSIATNRRVDPDRWFGVWPAKVVVKAGSTDPTEAHAVGVCYRVNLGRYDRDGLILKFLRQLDDPA